MRNHVACRRHTTKHLTPEEFAPLSGGANRSYFLLPKNRKAANTPTRATASNGAVGPLSGTVGRARAVLEAPMKARAVAQMDVVRYVFMLRRLIMIMLDSP